MNLKDVAAKFRGRGIPNASNPSFLKGVALAMGLVLHRVGKQDLLSARDAERLMRRVEEIHEPEPAAS